MRDSLALLCQNFIENRNTIKSAFGWDSEYIYPVCASIFIDKGQKVEEKIKKQPFSAWIMSLQRRAVR